MRLEASVAFLSGVVDLFAPRRCHGCDEPYVSQALCDACRESLEAADDPPEGVRVPWSHEGPLAKAIHRAKYGEDPAVARSLGKLLGAELGDWQGEFDRVVPVPLHRSRMAERGFNQSAELAKSVAKRLGARVDFSAVVRARATVSQTTLDVAGRRANVSGVFTVRDGKRIAGQRMLLIDDVVTTGATLAELRAVVEAAGAQRVECVAVARMARIFPSRR